MFKYTNSLKMIMEKDTIILNEIVLDALERRQQSRQQLTKFVHDRQRGRFEVPAGIGAIQVCAGYKIQRDESGNRVEVPVYRTRTF